MVDASPAPGALLAARSASGHDYFAGAIVLVVERDETGTIGVVLNRPSARPVAELLPVWAEAVAEPTVFFEGGPCEPDGALCLGRVERGAAFPEGCRPTFGQVALVSLEAPPDPRFTALRIYAGYTGWGPGQLEQELARGVWAVVASEPGDLFAAEPDEVWHRALRRQRTATAFLATWTTDPDWN